jgi:hypothetical protein
MAVFMEAIKSFKLGDETGSGEGKEPTCELRGNKTSVTSTGRGRQLE